MPISHYLKEIGRGKRAARALTREQAQDLFGQILDGKVSDLEIGAFCLAMRIKGETPDEMCGFLDALHLRTQKTPASQKPTVIIPSYNGARRLPVLTPLLALLIARERLPVLLHGMRTESHRVLASEVLSALGTPIYNVGEAIPDGTIALTNTADFSPGLAQLLAAREIIGLRNTGHSVAKLFTPCEGSSLLISSYTHLEYLHVMKATCESLGMNALLSRGLEGEVAADPRRSPRYDAFIGGAHLLLEEQQPGTASYVEGLPEKIDVETTAIFTRKVLDEKLPIPAAISKQVALISQLGQQIHTEI